MTEQNQTSSGEANLVRGLPMFSASDPEALAREKARLRVLDKRGFLGRWRGYLICPIETDQAKFMAKMKNHPEVMVRINMNHAIVSSGDLEAVYAEVDRVLELAASRGKVCIGTGALPYETDPQVVLESREYIRSIS